MSAGLDATGPVGHARPRESVAAFLALGLAAGFASSFLGIGGGLVIVPVLTTLLGYPLKRAVGTSLAAIVAVSAVGVATESIVKGENIHWATAAVLTAGALFGSWWGARLLARISPSALRWLLAATLAIAAVRMSGILALGPSEAPFASWNSGSGPAATVALGVLAGITSTLFGIGGGLVVVPGLTILFRDFAFHGARATSLAMIVPTSAFGAFLHSRLRNIDWRAAMMMIPSSLAGAVTGVIVVNRLPDRPLRYVFAAFLLVSVYRLVRAGGRP
jgi:uncharacterized membrane protein YfcA